MKKIFFMLIAFFSLAACTKNAGSANTKTIDFCNYAKVKGTLDQYNGAAVSLYGSQGISKCEVISNESEKIEDLGFKVIHHKVKLKLKIDQVVDDCDSKQGLDCNVRLKKESCIKENGVAVDFCKYPDAKVRTAKGTFIREEKRSLDIYQEENGGPKLQVIKNIELK